MPSTATCWAHMLMSMSLAPDVVMSTITMDLVYSLSWANTPQITWGAVAQVESVPNPSVEAEEHYNKAKHSRLQGTQARMLTTMSFAADVVVRMNSMDLSCTVSHGQTCCRLHGEYFL